MVWESKQKMAKVHVFCWACHVTVRPATCVAHFGHPPPSWGQCLEEDSGNDVKYRPCYVHSCYGYWKSPLHRLFSYTRMLSHPYFRLRKGTRICNIWIPSVDHAWPHSTHVSSILLHGDFPTHAHNSTKICGCTYSNSCSPECSTLPSSNKTCWFRINVLERKATWW